MKKQIIKLYIKTTCLVLILGLIIFFIYGFITCNQAKDTLFKNAEIKKEQFVKDYLSVSNTGGIAATDQRFEFVPTNTTAYSVPQEQTEAINRQIYS